MTRVVVAAAVAFVAAVALTPLAMAVALRTGIVDRPGPLKPHAAPVPYLGGVAVLAAACAGGVAGRPEVVVPLVGAALLGVLDDRFGLSATVRLVAMALVGAAVAWAVPTRIGGVGGVALEVVATVVLANGVNFLDGLDALAAGVVAVAAAGFAVVLPGDARVLGVALSGALVGFLVYNRPPARVYLGDAGAYVLGTATALLAAWAWAPGVRTAVGVAGLGLVALPALEIAFAVVRRARARRSVTSGDRRHPYDLLVARGWPAAGAAGAYVGAEIVAAALSVAASHARTVAVAVVAVLVVAAGATTAAAACGALAPAHEGAP